MMGTRLILFPLPINVITAGSCKVTSQTLISINSCTRAPESYKTLISVRSRLPFCVLLSGCSKKQFYRFWCQIFHYCFLCFFNRNVDDLLKIKYAIRFFCLYISKKRMNSSKPLISGRDTALSICFQPFEKINDPLLERIFRVIFSLDFF